MKRWRSLELLILGSVSWLTAKRHIPTSPSLIPEALHGRRKLISKSSPHTSTHMSWHGHAAFPECSKPLKPPGSGSGLRKQTETECWLWTTYQLSVVKPLSLVVHVFTDAHSMGKEKRERSWYTSTRNLRCVSFGVGWLFLEVIRALQKNHGVLSMTKH